MLCVRRKRRRRSSGAGDGGAGDGDGSQVERALEDLAESRREQELAKERRFQLHMETMKNEMME